MQQYLFLVILWDAWHLLQVRTSSGTRALNQCFLETDAIPSNLAKLLKELQVPFLDVPDPACGSWLFLKAAGVSQALEWADLYKVLAQPSEAQASPDVSSMQQLYEQVRALTIRDPDIAVSVGDAFAQTPLVFVPKLAGKDATWVSSREALWEGIRGSSSREIFPDKIFLSEHYKASTTWITNTSIGNFAWS
jgi:hypothetical protein